MKIPSIRWKWLAAIVLAGIVAWWIYSLLRPFKLRHPEPSYQGKTLQAWAREVDLNDFFRKPTYRQRHEKSERAIVAIQHIGTNALPAALDLLAAKYPWLKRKTEEVIQQWIDRYNSQVEEHNEGFSKDQWRRKIQFAFISEGERQYEGANIIWALGATTKPIVPQLIQLFQSPDKEIVENMMLALPGAGTNVVPPLIKLLDNTNKDVRIRSAMILGKFFSSQAHPAVPVLLHCLNDSNLNLVRHLEAIYSLGCIGQDASVIVPAVTNYIRRGMQLSEINTNRLPSNYMEMRSCFSVLGRLGTNATSAVPFLVHFLKTERQFTRNAPLKGAALGALNEIDPEMAKPFLEKRRAENLRALGGTNSISR